MGSKNKIAKDIIDFLPQGKRLVDLFGGGGAITHCASLSGKWDLVHYNELNKLAHDLLKDAINGKYKDYKPEWISREDFFRLKETDGYVKYLWSFGNKGDSYLFGKDIEEYKRLLHNAVVFNQNLTDVSKFLPEFNEFPDECKSIKDRRLYLHKLLKCGGRSFVQLQRLEQLERLERLERLEPSNKITFSNLDYKDVEFQDGDIVYCDIPYKDTGKYNNKSNFNHDEFYKWVRDCDLPVYVSEYKAPDFMRCVWSKEKRVNLSSQNKSKVAVENIFWNGKY